MNHFQGSSGRVVLFFPSWSGAVPDVILPIVITLIVITLSVFSLVALYKMCQKKTPERQENGAEQAQSDKEGVKLLSVKTTSSETDVVLEQWDKSGAGADLVSCYVEYI
ncbi:endomucin-like isoform X5 [Aphelocoma coerulescens]|uniref:endomucin-like isoform X5 n=1 Tax=Aphelocoma coerulescens TaxID=39617 RepID=UPI0036046552